MSFDQVEVKINQILVYLIIKMTCYMGLKTIQKVYENKFCSLKGICNLLCNAGLLHIYIK